MRFHADAVAWTGRSAPSAGRSAASGDSGPCRGFSQADDIQIAGLRVGAARDRLNRIDSATLRQKLPLRQGRLGRASRLGRWTAR